MDSEAHPDSAIVTRTGGDIVERPDTIVNGVERHPDRSITLPKPHPGKGGCGDAIGCTLSSGRKFVHDGTLPHGGRR
jgi:hypothetical protein